MTETLDQWKARAQSATRCSPEMIDKIADLCANHPELFPKAPNIWHATWLAFEKKFPCNCYDCRPTP